MKTYAIITLSFILAGCQTLPMTNDFPKAPDTLMEKCDSLNTINKPQVLLSEFVTTVTKNYGKYHECADKVEAWKEWYQEQKKINDNLKK